MADVDDPSGRFHIAYFSMEVALENHIPAYDGGLGVLAGDTLRSAADLGLPMVGVTLLCRRGSLSALDGSWPEGFVDGITGRAARRRPRQAHAGRAA
jgi:glucan phosphorylase